MIRTCAALCLLGNSAFAEVYPTSIGPLVAFYDERYVIFSGWVTRDDGTRAYESEIGAVRFQFPDKRTVPFSNENEAAVRQALIAFCTETTGIDDFDEFLFVDNELIGLCYDMVAKEP